MDTLNVHAHPDLYRALREIFGPDGDLTVRATYGPTPSEVLGIDVRFTPPSPDADAPPIDSAAPPPGLMTTDDVATYLGVSPRTVQTIVAEGSLSPIKVRSQTRFDPRDVEAYVRRSTRGRLPARSR